MNELTENLTIRCSPADLEIIDWLRGEHSRGWLLRSLVREAALEAAERCA